MFDEIGPLTATAAIELGFDAEARRAATSPGPSFPRVLRTLADAVPKRPDATIVDLGAGLGGASTWLAAETGARVLAVEPAAGARWGARRLFPDLDVRPGSAARSGLPAGIADAVVLLGVISLLDDLGSVLAEARRLLGPDGVVAIADMFIDGDGLERSGVNTLRSLSVTRRALADAGLELVAAGCANDASPDEAWRRRADDVKQWLVHHHGHDPAVEGWIADQRQLADWIDGEHVFGACLVAAECGAPPGSTAREAVAE
jgi:SAM-dependent methyltransferase